MEITKENLLLDKASIERQALSLQEQLVSLAGITKYIEQLIVYLDKREETTEDKVVNNDTND